MQSPIAPNRNLHLLQTELNRMIDQMRFDADWTQPFGRAIEQVNAKMWAPNVDIAEDKEAFHLHIDLPGLGKEDIRVHIENDLLTIEGERKHEAEKTEEANGRSFHRKERIYGRFSRAFRLPATVNQQNIQARFENGVLNLMLPKQEAAKPKQIEVRIGTAPSLAETPAAEQA